MVNLKVFHISELDIPCKATLGSACFDISAFFEDGEPVHGFDNYNSSIQIFPDRLVPFEDTPLTLTIDPLTRVLIPTGLIFDIPTGYSVRIHSRSGLSYKYGLILTNGEGIIDSDYVEPVYISLTNISQAPVTLINGMRLAQCELYKNISSEIIKINQRPCRKTSRSGGFGSTDQKKK